ncbi:Chaperone protein HtpG [Lachnospiraceae bacterium TWA4]|nr:Chaperone protein HtpG [Lachnospiraceae bacterium TWA4]
MASKSGNLTINSENIFPIIKKWLYSDHDIFYRELVSNACDAITKLKKLEIMGEYNFADDYKAKVEVTVDANEKSITVSDNGIGMTFEEVDEYINQIAFSGAADFLEKYKDKTNEDQIIGHFGLGFYSAFMVADKVTIDSLSYREGAKAVHWESEAGVDFKMSESEKTSVGTTIKLYLNEDSYEFSNEYRAREVLEKYCSFMPTEIFLTVAGKEQEYETVEPSEVRDDDVVVETIVEEAKTEEKENENGEKEVVEVSPAKEMVKINKRPVALNDTTPLWAKHPNECSDEEYKKFYTKVFHDYKEPLFWIHLNMDYPFNLKGILYFPKINMEYESAEGVIKLYNNQVFIADNIKEVIPEFLMLLKGVIDCPDLPLNVSRSALQNDGFVKKISDYITKKVADKLTGMCKTDKDSYIKYWDDISPFIKYGCLKDEKFDDKMKDFMLLKDTKGEYKTLAERLEDNKEKHENTIFYTDNENEQAQYVKMYNDAGVDVVILNARIDNPYISHLEQKNENLKFYRVDGELNDSFKDEVSEDETKRLEETTTAMKELFKKALNNEQLEVKVEKLKSKDVASMITLSEQNRRMQDMMKMYGMDSSMFGGSDGQTLVLNFIHPLVQFVVENPEGEYTSKICEQLYDLALLSHGSLSPERMSAFVTRSNELMLLLK